jgi:hypothetical protein
MGWSNAQTISELCEQWCWEAFGHNIGKLVLSWYVQYLELTECHLLTNEVDIKLDMLGPAMMYRVFCKVNRRYIVTIDHRGFIDDDVELLQ